MALEKDLLNQIRKLSPDNQREVLDFVAHLARKRREMPPLRNPRGIFSDLGAAPSEKSIDDARREAWGNFPRDEF